MTTERRDRTLEFAKRDRVAYLKAWRRIASKGDWGHSMTRIDDCFDGELREWCWFMLEALKLISESEDIAFMRMHARALIAKAEGRDCDV
jgi:hypothetical protein